MRHELENLARGARPGAHPGVKGAARGLGAALVGATFSRAIPPPPASGWTFDVATLVLGVSLGIAFATSSSRARGAFVAAAAITTLSLWASGLAAVAVAAVALAAALCAWGLLAPRDATSLVGVGLAVGALAPTALTAVLYAVAGEDGRTVIASEIAVAITPKPLLGAAAAGTALACVGRVVVGEAIQRRAVVLGAACAALALVLLGVRGHWIVSYATVPTDMVVWSEAPVLLDLLKLRTGAVLYGAASEASSYIYSPGLELLHHALLAPFELDLSLIANRALVLGWQAATIVVLGAAVVPLLDSGKGSAATLYRVGAVSAVATAVLSSLLAPHLHPDHPMLLCFAGALAVALRGPAMPRWLRDGLLVGIPVAATVFKLTGAGVGFGLVLAFVFERDRRALVALGVAAVLALATVPLFDATLGDFSAYAIRLPSEHPMVWSRLVELLGLPEALVAAAAALVVLYGAARWPRDERGRAAIRAALVTFGTTTVSFASFLKYGGRTNSLVPMLVGSVVVLLVGLAWAAGGRPRAPTGALVAAGAVWLGLAVEPTKPALVGDARAGVVALHGALVRHLGVELAAGGRPLSYTSTAAWLDAGRRDVPTDRFQSVVELHYARRPEVREHLARLERGDYTSVATVTSVLEPRHVLERPLVLAILDRLERRYERHSEGELVIYVRRDRSR